MLKPSMAVQIGVACALLALTGAPIGAQKGTGACAGERAACTTGADTASRARTHITGIVVSPNWTRLPGAEVVTLTADSVVTTGDDGSFTVSRDDAAQTVIRVRRPGWKETVLVVADSIEALEIVLQPDGALPSESASPATRTEPVVSLSQELRRPGNWSDVASISASNRPVPWELAETEFDSSVWFRMQVRGAPAANGCPTHLVVDGKYMQRTNLLVAGVPGHSPSLIAFNSVPLRYATVVPGDQRCPVYEVRTR
jgi:hypothetical protein